MEVGYVRGKASRETSPERVKVHLPSKMRQIRKVHVIYYLCRNGQLEQPHFMEVSLFPNKHLKLRDVMERLVSLRGRAMLSLYSWSCKRTYKNGYVWNDLGEDDVIHPSDGTDYILKGSEILDECREGIQQLKLQSKKNTQASISCSSNNNLPPAEGTGDVEEVEEENCKVLHQYSYDQTKPKSENGNHCSRGVSTEEELDENLNTQCNKQQQQMDLPFDEEGSSPPSSASSDKTTIITHEPNQENPPNATTPSITTTNFHSTEPQMKPLASVLHHLIACGNPMTVKRRASLLLKSPLSSTSTTTTIRSERNNQDDGGGGSGRKSSVGGLQRGVLCRVAATRAVVEDDEAMNEIRYMSENPRFGLQQLEDKEYFSGSIAEAMSTDMRGSAQPQPSLKKSSSYNEERSNRCRIGDDMVNKVEEKSGSGRCIPSKKRRPSSKQQKKAGK